MNQIKRIKKIKPGSLVCLKTPDGRLTYVYLYSSNKSHLEPIKYDLAFPTAMLFLGYEHNVDEDVNKEDFFRINFLLREEKIYMETAVKYFNFVFPVEVTSPAELFALCMVNKKLTK